MPDLSLTDEHKQYQELARNFAQQEIEPKADSHDISGELPLHILKQSWELGLLNPSLPETLGGLGLKNFDACIIAEELSTACAGIGASFWGNDLAVAPLIVAGTVQQQKEWLGQLVDKFALAAYCFSDISNQHIVRYQSTKTGVQLSGTAIAINARHAAWIFLSATGSGAERTSLLLPLSTPGITVKERLPALGIKAADLSIVEFRAVSVPNANILIDKGQGTLVDEKAGRLTFPLSAAYVLGIARAALQHGV